MSQVCLNDGPDLTFDLLTEESNSGYFCISAVDVLFFVGLQNNFKASPVPNQGG